MNKRIWIFMVIAALMFCMVGCSKQPSGIGDPDDPNGIQESDPDDHSLSQQNGKNEGEESSSGEGTAQQGSASEGNSGSGDTSVGNGGVTQEGDSPVSNNPFGSEDQGSTSDGKTGNTAGNGNSSSSAGSSGSVNSGSGTVTTVPDKTEDCTYEEYHAMTPEAQQQFFAKFDSVEDFFVWYNAAKAQYEKDNPAIEIGDGEIDLDEVVGSGK